MAPQEHREKGNKDEVMETEYTCIVVPYRDEETAISLLKTTNVNEESKGRQLLSNEKSNNVDLSSVECTKSVQEHPQNQRLIKSTTACLQGSRCDQMLTRSIPARAVVVAEEVLENEMMRTDIVASTEGFEDVYLPGATTQGAILDLRNVLEHDNTFDLPTNLLEKGRVFPGDSHHNESSATSIENDGNVSEHSKDSEILKQIRYYFPYILLLGALLCLTVGSVRIFKHDETSLEWMQAGSNIDGERKYSHFGESVSLSADGCRVAIGSVGNELNGKNSGNLRLFDLSECRISL